MIKTEILHGDNVVETDFFELGDSHPSVWIDVTDPDDSELRSIAEFVKLEELDLKELMDSSQRPVLQDVGDFTALVFHSLVAEGKKVKQKPHLFLVSKERKFLISLHKETSLSAGRMQGLPDKRKVEVFKKGALAILFMFLDSMVSRAHEAIEYFGEELSKTESEIFRSNNENILQKIFQLKKQLMYYQRTLSADREVVLALLNVESAMDKKTNTKYRLLYSDILQIIETINLYREIVISTVEIHLSSVSNNLNLVMKRLTSWAAIILVPSLIAGIYGMNLVFLPFARQAEGFYIVLAVMFASVGILYWYFKQKDWL